MINNLGYACICLSLPQKGEDCISTGRTLRQATFQKDKNLAEEICFKNSLDLIKILRWNKDNGINYFRVGSNFFPFMDHPTLGYKLEDTKYFKQIDIALEECGWFVRLYNMRLSCHPGQYCCIASPTESVVDASIRCLEMHSKIGDLLGCGPEFKINIHLGGSYGNKKEAAERFCKSFDRLSKKTKSRLTIENDDKANCFSTKELHELVYKKIGIPICFDIHHHNIYTGGLSSSEAFNLSYETWGGIIPEVHYSEGRDKPLDRSHSDWVSVKLPEYDKPYDCMLEVKQKDLALLKYREDIQKGIL
jgi:UV DNA damage endonuclease